MRRRVVVHPLARRDEQRRGAPPFSLVSGERVGEQPQRVVQEYPEFETEFGLPQGLDLTTPPQVAFPPPQEATAWATAQTTPQARPTMRWTKEAIELEELENQRPHLSEESYCKQSRKVHDKIHHQVAVEMRKRREAEWEAEAARRNAKEEEKAQRWRSMDAAQQRAFMEGVMIGREEEAAERREQEARAKKPAAKVGGEEAIRDAGWANCPRLKRLSEGNKEVTRKPLGLKRLRRKSL